MAYLSRRLNTQLSRPVRAEKKRREGTASSRGTATFRGKPVGAEKGAITTSGGVEGNDEGIGSGGSAKILQQPETST